MASSAAPSPSSSSSTRRDVPRVGGVRCYWALVAPRYTESRGEPSTAVITTNATINPTTSTANGNGNGNGNGRLELTFVHLDPVLSVHLARQKMSLMGRGVMEFIHPAEREQARRDLSSAIAADDLQGSVTRVRYARLSRIRTILGCPPEENEFPSDATMYAEDDEYLILDLVLNWVAEGLLLAFFHAIKDKDPVHDNDPKRAHEEWSNWCGTKEMDDEQIEALHHNISSSITLPHLTHYPPTRVFQLHYVPTSSPAARPHVPQLIFSWPPARPPGERTELDGKYNATEYCEMMRGVNMDPAQLTAGPGELRTNCTTRYGAQHSIATEGVYRHVMGVFIPYGNLIFACFQTTKLYELPTHRNGHTQAYTDMPAQVATSNASASSDWTVPAGSASVEQHDWTQAATTSGTEHPWNTPTEYQSTSSNTAHHSINSDVGYHTPSSATTPYGQPQQHYTDLQGSGHLNQIAGGSSEHHAHSVHHGHQHPHHHPHHHHQPHTQPNHRTHMQDSAQTYAGIPDQAIHSNSSTNAVPTNGSTSSSNTVTSNTGIGASASTNINVGGSSRPLVRPPGNVDCCVICGIRESPEWRRNESGIKDLCNACGLRLARQVAKREGRQKPRKKKEGSATLSTGGTGGGGTKSEYGISASMA